MIVGFAGAAGSGKDTAAKAIIENLDYHKESWARPLKEALNVLFGWHMKDWDSLEWKEAVNPAALGRTPRYVAQTFGTDWGRHMIGEDIWVELVMRGLVTDRPVFTDVRFPNEAKAIRKAGGVVIYVRCVDQSRGTDLSGHESELWLPWLERFADATIQAQFGDIYGLQQAAVHVVQGFLKGQLIRYEPDEGEWDKLNAIREKVTAQLRG